MAATGTPTPNIGLRIPQGTDPASVDDINYNSNLLDTKLGAVGKTSVQDQIDSLNSKMPKTGTIAGTTSASGNIPIAGRLLGKNIYCCGCNVYDSSDNLLQDVSCIPIQYSVTGTGVVLGFNIRSSASPFNAVANTSIKVRYMYFDNEIT